MSRSEVLAEAGEAGWLPIREVARLTGVNPVTLRAWERRYGLIVPRRTPKGHRLYDQRQVERIHEVLAWLNRGAAVGQVKALLDAPKPPAVNEPSPWQEQQAGLLEAITRCAERSLDDRFNHAMALYPPRTLCEQLLLPVLRSLEQRWQGQYGAELERVFFHSWLRSKLGARLYHHNRQQAGEPLLLISLSGLPFEPGLWLSAWLASSTECPVQVLDWPVPAPELRLVLEQLQPRALVLYSSLSLEATYLRLLPRLAQPGSVPLLLAGPAARLHRSELAGALTLAADPLQVVECLGQQDLLGPRAGGRP